MENKKNTGLKIRKFRDPRTFSHTKVFGAVPISQIPNDFVVAEPLKIKDQKDTDMCSAFASSSVSEDQEGVELSPEFIFYKTKLIMGDWKSWGASLEDCCKAHTRFGALEQTETPFTLQEKELDFIANPKNWTDISLNAKAKKHKKQAYFEADGYNDSFDAIRATMWQNRTGKRTILAGCYFQPEWTNAPQGRVSEVPQDTRIDKSLPHAVKIYGSKEIDGVVYLMLQNSWGNDMGDNGTWYIPRGEVNRCFLYAYTFKDYDPNEVKVDWTLWQKLYDVLMNLIKVLHTTYGSIFRKT